MISGSVRHNGQYMKRLREELEAKGHEVFSPEMVPYPKTHDPEEKAVDRRVYFKEIQDADAVVVATRGHIGIGTALEIGCALSFGKPIFFTDETEVDELRAMLQDQSASLYSTWEHTLGSKKQN